ncbi:hypothetical protein, partial [Escherichia coli]
MTQYSSLLRGLAAGSAFLFLELSNQV